MRFHRIDSDRSGGTDSKPTLDAVMHHFDVDFNDQRNTGMAKCPLHDDNTPSFSYRIDEGLWNCHSCSNGGDSFTLIEKYHEMQLGKAIDFKQAKAYAKEHGLEEGAVAKETSYTSRYGGGRRTPSKAAGKKPGGGYVPAWKRK
ncbi:CHC2 zinc finger domain-containing protein [Streptomyces sp. ID05-39B]|uniref:CHC2 zinc finger domain-containing protein n=1 Tax=Streptomyces sp. ID05-39B TaxID=3028664 RepID=UPI0029A0F5F6|nr:CHC2 zinc finger domain-containing protein [Streptomyces sp. ID05-39B]MDX3525052.1 CHC2 zinc finger domain-containing protein [Streptomyces sp. ID05-39B]